MEETPLMLMQPATENLYHVLRPVLLEHLEAFRSHPDLEGIVVLGGAADTDGRRFLDRFSDLDATIFVSVPIASKSTVSSVREFLDQHQELLPAWLPPFSTRVPCAGHPDGEVEVNLHQMIVELESRESRQWDEMKKEGNSPASRCS